MTWCQSKGWIHRRSLVLVIIQLDIFVFGSVSMNIQNCRCSAFHLGQYLDQVKNTFTHDPEFTRARAHTHCYVS